MGADLYVVGIDEGAQAACGFEVSIKAAKVGYFRDPYNEHGLFRQIGDRVIMVAALRGLQGRGTDDD